MSAADRFIRVAAALAVLIVAGIAAVISYRHAYELVSTHGESGWTARALPLTVDGLILTCSLVLLDAARRRVKAPALAWWLLGAGVVATLGANVAHGWQYGPVGIAVAGWPALVAVGSFEMLARLIRGGRTTVPAAVADPATAVAPEPVPAVPGAAGDVPGVLEAAAELPMPVPEPEPAVPAVAAEVPAARVWDVAAVSEVPEPAEGVPAVPVGVPGPDEQQVKAAEVFAEQLGRGQVPGIRAIKSTLKVGQPKAAVVRAYLSVLAER